MQKTRFKKSLLLIVCTVLIAAMALLTTGCNNTEEAPDSSSVAETESSTPAAESSAASDTSAVSETPSLPESNVLGEGENNFTFKVVDADGKETVFEIRTNKTVVGDALLELNLIAGDEGPYGLYVKTVNGITVDYDTDGKYWAFYVNGAYGMTGVDMTNIENGATYSFKVE